MKDMTQLFTVLAHHGLFVDEGMLGKGIYWTRVPSLHPLGSTIEGYAEKIQIAKDMAGNSFISQNYIDNLRKCEFLTVSMTLVNTSEPSSPTIK